MKFFLFIFLSFSSSLFACGCVDSASASSGAKAINKNYDAFDKEFSNKIKKLEDKIQETINKETINKKKMVKNISLDEYKILELENAIFTTKKIKEIK